MSMYKKLLESVKENKSFHINLNKKDLIIGKKKFIINQEKIEELELIKSDDLNELFNEDIQLDKNPWDIIRFLFEKYKFSVPSTNYKDNSYFKAVKAEELEVQQLVMNIDRKLAQAILEGYILLASLSGWIEWLNEDKWFWQDKYHEELIIIKNWVSG